MKRRQWSALLHRDHCNYYNESFPSVLKATKPLMMNTVTSICEDLSLTLYKGFTVDCDNICVRFSLENHPHLQKESIILLWEYKMLSWKWECISCSRVMCKLFRILKIILSFKISSQFSWVPWVNKLLSLYY